MTIPLVIMIVKQNILALFLPNVMGFCADRIITINLNSVSVRGQTASARTRQQQFRCVFDLHACVKGQEFLFGGKCLVVSGAQLSNQVVITKYFLHENAAKSRHKINGFHMCQHD